MSNAAKWWMQEVHNLPCVVCGNTHGITAHHPCDGALGRAFGRKAPDTMVIALCASCHEQLHAGRESFERLHGDEANMVAKTIEGMARRLMR